MSKTGQQGASFCMPERVQRQNGECRWIFSSSLLDLSIFYQGSVRSVAELKMGLGVSEQDVKKDYYDTFQFSQRRKFHDGKGLDWGEKNHLTIAAVGFLGRGGFPEK